MADRVSRPVFADVRYNGVVCASTRSVNAVDDEGCNVYLMYRKSVVRRKRSASMAKCYSLRSEVNGSTCCGD